MLLLSPDICCAVVWIQCGRCEREKKIDRNLLNNIVFDWHLIPITIYFFSLTWLSLFCDSNKYANVTIARHINFFATESYVARHSHTHTFFWVHCKRIHSIFFSLRSDINFNFLRHLHNFRDSSGLHVAKFSWFATCLQLYQPKFHKLQYALTRSIHLIENQHQMPSFFVTKFWFSLEICVSFSVPAVGVLCVHMFVVAFSACFMEYCYLEPNLGFLILYILKIMYGLHMKHSESASK